MSVENNFEKVFSTLTTPSPILEQIMETTEIQDMRDEAVASVTSTATKIGSVVSIPDEDVPQPAISPIQASSAGAGEERGTKRSVEREAEGGNAKKAKTGDGGSPAGRESGTGPNREETIAELKERANSVIRKKNSIIVDLRGQLGNVKAELADSQNECAALEERRDDWRAVQIFTNQKHLAQSSGQTDVKAAEERDWCHKTTAKIKADLKRVFDEKLANKTASIEKRLHGKHATAERNLHDKLNNKTEKLEETLIELRELKEKHKLDVRDLKALASEQAKAGGPKAQQALRDCQSHVKAKQKELTTAHAEIEYLKKQIIHHRAETNAERTQKDNFTEVYTKQCADVKRLAAKCAEWKKRCGFLLRDTNIAAQKHHAALQALRATHDRDTKELNAKWQVQADNSAESQQRVVIAQRTIFGLKHANARLVARNAACQTQLVALAAEKRRREEECAGLRGQLSLLGVVVPRDGVQVTSETLSSRDSQLRGQAVEDGEVVMREDWVPDLESRAESQRSLGGSDVVEGSSVRFDALVGGSDWNFPASI